MTTSIRLRCLAPALLLAAGLGLAGCSSGGTDESTASQDTEAPATQEQDSPESDLALDTARGSVADGEAVDRTVDVGTGPDTLAQPAIIQTGNMTVRPEAVFG